MKSGDFTKLADDYSKYRPDYSVHIRNSILGLLGKPIGEVDFVDVGAGTGIWTRMVQKSGVKSVTAIEPNPEMLRNGIADSEGLSIRWIKGSAESVDLPAGSCDWLSMASSFHWADFDRATTEFHRLLKPGGWFTALWNPRWIESNPLLIEIEEYLRSLKPNVQRVSSGRSGITETLTEKLSNCPHFHNVIYMEGYHVIQMDPKRYLGAWRSVNDLQVQLGDNKFNAFLEYIEGKINSLPFIEATYLTRAWSAQRKE